MQNKKTILRLRHTVFSSSATAHARRLAGVALLALLVFAGSARAANWYVRPNTTGSANGTDWNNAWSLNGINWGSVNPGDTVWLAGGTYTTTFTLNDKGTAANPIYVKRPLASDVVPTAAAGWSAAFDSQVLVAPSSTSVLSFYNSGEAGSYFYVDGRTDSGIKLQAANGSGAYNAPFYIGALSAIHDSTFVNVDCAGPDDGSNSNFAHQGNNAALTIRAVNSAVSGDPFNTISNLTFISCRFHGAANIVTMAKGLNIVWDKCKFYDNVALGTSASVAHQNMFEIIASGYLTLRNCEMWNWSVEGLMPYGSALGPIYVYGCLFRDPYLYPSTGSSVARCFEIFTSYKILAYNNTFVNMTTAVGVWSTANGGRWTADSEAKNNIYWNCNFGSYSPAENYEFSSGSVSGANSISGGSNPFVNYSGKDYRIVPTVGAKYPKDKGVALTPITGQTFNADMEGKTRGADGSWDIGAFEYGTGVVSTNPVISVTPASQDLGSVVVGSSIDRTFTVKNVGAGTLAGTASVSPPFSIVSGGNYGLGSNQSQTVTIRYSPSAAGNSSQNVIFTGGGGATVPVTAAGLVVQASLTFGATAGTITPPFSSTGGYVSQATETGVTDGGRAVYGFSVPSAGNYKIILNLNAPSDAANSLFVNVDAEPVDPTMIWDIPVTTGFADQAVGWRGAGTFDANEFTPKLFPLTAGTHQLIVRGREGGVQLNQISIKKPLAAPPNLTAK